MTRGVVLRQGPFLVFFAKPTATPRRNLPAEMSERHGKPPSFAILNQRPADLPGEAPDCKACEPLIDLPEQAQRLSTPDAIRGDLKARGTKPIIPPKSNPPKMRYSKELYTCAIGSSA